MKTKTQRACPKKKLPSKANKLIRLAMHDLAACEKDKRYKIDMFCYHSPNYVGKCSVCLAGAVMAQTLRVDIGKWSVPMLGADHDYDFGNNEYKLLALDRFRAGWIHEGLAQLGKTDFGRVPDFVRITAYDVDRRKFRREMLSLADMLEKHGF